MLTYVLSSWKPYLLSLKYKLCHQETNWVLDSMIIWSYTVWINLHQKGFSFLPGSNRRPCACEAHVITATLRKPWCYPIQDMAPRIVTIVPQIWHPAYFYCPWEGISLAPIFPGSNQSPVGSFWLGGTWQVWNRGLFNWWLSSTQMALLLMPSSETVCKAFNNLWWSGFCRFLIDCCWSWYMYHFHLWVS